MKVRGKAQQIGTANIMGYFDNPTGDLLSFSFLTQAAFDQYRAWLKRELQQVEFRAGRDVMLRGPLADSRETLTFSWKEDEGENS